MKPASETGLGLAFLCIVANAVLTFFMGLEHMAVSWIVLACVLLMSIWARLMQIADLLQSKTQKAE